jgi:hypothetical protein
MPMDEEFTISVVKDNFINPRTAQEVFYEKLVFEK